MNFLQQLLDERIMIEAIEFGHGSDFTLVSRLRGQRMERKRTITIGQLRILLAAMREYGRVLQDVIDETYEKYRFDYDLMYRGKQIRIEMSGLFGKPFTLLKAGPGLPEAA
ncbi:MAG: hypothetical protein R6V49_04535 [Bacteroidales bacterium]